MTKTTWENKVKAQIQDKETEVKGKKSVSLDEKSFFKVFQVDYRTRSKGRFSYRFSGSEAFASSQISLFNNIREFFLEEVNSVGDLTADEFEEWARAFEDGFPTLQGKPKTWTNQSRPWGRNKDKAPKIKNISPAPYKNREGEIIEPIVKFILFQPDRSDDEFHFFVNGVSYSDCILSILNLWNQYNFFLRFSWENFVGYPVKQQLRQEPKTGIQLQIVLAPIDESPWVRRIPIAGDRFVSLYQTQITIPYPKKELLTYERIRQACGGSAGLDWGQWKARAYISLDPEVKQLKGLSQLVVGGNTEDEARRNLDKFLPFTHGHEINRTCTGNKLDSPADLKNPRTPFIKSYKVKPAWIYVENAWLYNNLDIAGEAGATSKRSSNFGTIAEKDLKLLINTPQEPPGWSAALAAALRKGD